MQPDRPGDLSDPKYLGLLAHGARNGSPPLIPLAGLRADHYGVTLKLALFRPLLSDNDDAMLGIEPEEALAKFTVRLADDCNDPGVDYTLRGSEQRAMRALQLLYWQQLPFRAVDPKDVT